MELAGVSLSRELRALALSHTIPVRRGTAGELGHNFTYRQHPHAVNGRLHQAHQPLREERIGNAVPGLAHRVGAEWSCEWRGREERALDAAAQVERVNLSKGPSALTCFRRLSCAQPGVR